MSVPKRSPDLNVLDYRIWANINQRMRNAERSWSHSHRESRAEYKGRLMRTALATPRAFIRNAVQDMVRRCELLVEAKGWYFQE